MQLADIMRMAPVDMCVVGRKRNYILRALDLVFKNRSQARLETDLGVFEINLSFEPERVFFYCYYNLLRYYTKSDLGRYIGEVAVSGSTFIDIGANLGIYALIARRAGMTAIVIEPEPAHASFLMRNEVIYGRVAGIAISNAPGELPLYYDATNPAGTSLCNALDYKRGAGSVPVRTFSELAREGLFGPLNRVALIKIDVEGYEVEAVEGMKEAFGDSTFRPDIWCEVRGDTAGRAPGSFRGVRALLESIGYTTYWHRNGENVELTEAALAAEQVFDLLFKFSR